MASKAPNRATRLFFPQSSALSLLKGNRSIAVAEFFFFLCRTKFIRARVVFVWRRRRSLARDLAYFSSFLPSSSSFSSSSSSHASAHDFWQRVTNHPAVGDQHSLDVAPPRGLIRHANRSGSIHQAPSRSHLHHRRRHRRGAGQSRQTRRRQSTTRHQRPARRCTTTSGERNNPPRGVDRVAGPTTRQARAASKSKVRCHRS